MSGLANCIAATSCIMRSSRKIGPCSCMYVERRVPEIILSFIAITDSLYFRSKSPGSKNRSGQGFSNRLVRKSASAAASKVISFLRESLLRRDWPATVLYHVQMGSLLTFLFLLSSYYLFMIVLAQRTGLQTRKLLHFALWDLLHGILLRLAVHSEGTYEPLHLRMLGWLPVLRIRIRVGFGRLDLDPGRQNLPTKIQKSERMSCFEVLDILFLGLQDSSVD